MVASLAGEAQVLGTRELWFEGLVVSAHGIIPDQESNPFPLQTDFSPLYPPGKSEVEHLSKCLLIIYLLWRSVNSDLLPIFNLIICLFIIEV